MILTAAAAMVEKTLYRTKMPPDVNTDENSLKHAKLALY